MLKKSHDTGKVSGGPYKMKKSTTCRLQYSLFHVDEVRSSPVFIDNMSLVVGRQAFVFFIYLFVPIYRYFAYRLCHVVFSG